MWNDAIKSGVFALLVSTVTLGKPTLEGDVNKQHGALPFLGHDISSLIMMERDLKYANYTTFPFKDSSDFGFSITYLNASGKPEALEHILAAGGAKAARLRIWVHPVEGVYGLEYNLQLARRIQDAGMGVYLDFHYSDTWADPQRM